MKKEKNKEGINCVKMAIYFFTKEGKIQLPDREIFPKGKVVLPTNHRHGIRSSKEKEVHFGGGGDQPLLMNAIKQCLKNYEIIVIPKEQKSKYKKLLKVKENIENREMEL